MGVSEREPVKVNLPPDVREAWRKHGRGYPHTRLAIAALAAYALLDPAERESLMLRVELVDKGERAWDYIAEWIDEVQAKRKAQISQAAEDYLAAHRGDKTHGKRPGHRADKRQGTPRQRR